MSGFVTHVFDILHNLLAVEQGCRLLERLALGLDQEQKDVDKLEQEPAAIHNVLQDVSF